jgi:hypothetical protein
MRDNVRFGSLPDICSAKGHVRFTPESRHFGVRSECPLRAKSGHPTLFNHFISTPDQIERHSDAKRPSSFEVDD